MLSKEEVAPCVRKLVFSTEVVDVHTHLFPPSHGQLLLYGPDQMLTYHYLVAEFLTAHDSTLAPEQFFSLSVTQQADLIWFHAPS
jgi:hypothetical protein